MQHLKPKYNIVIHCVTFIEKQVTYNVQNMEIFEVAEIQSTRIKNIKILPASLLHSWVLIKQEEKCIDSWYYNRLQLMQFSWEESFY